MAKDKKPKTYTLAELADFVAGGSVTEAGAAAGLTEADLVGGAISNEARERLLGAPFQAAPEPEKT